MLGGAMQLAKHAGRDAVKKPWRDPGALVQAEDTAYLDA